ncbi:MAG: 4-hydroxythreonine-4-phosphate dehydrogenase PdxA [Flammeovirgaceae bacterium]|nr:4-hydroxythreonine-4-phosphate dehydrogenase PdxA [Flammeovirgaceae bacterium]
MDCTNLDRKSIPIIGISTGDLNGIGIEVTLKSLENTSIFSKLTPIIYASMEVLNFYSKLLKKSHLDFHVISEPQQAIPIKINVIPVWTESVIITPGKSNATGGKYAKKSLEAAVTDLKTESINGLVTAPLSKDLLNEQGFSFPGHTEYLAASFQVSENLMLMVKDRIRVAVATGHIPIAKVPESLTTALISEKLQILIDSLQTDFRIKAPKVALTGLNPHAGENGLMGNEEQKIINKVIHKFNFNGYFIKGPFPADGFFGSDEYLKYDGILTMYHDQGLIPFKSIAKGSGVNFTAGLPIVRTSPAHGTAFNLAGKNIANPSSMTHALLLASTLAKNKDY